MFRPALLLLLLAVMFPLRTSRRGLGLVLDDFVPFVQRMPLAALASEGSGESAQDHGECGAEGTRGSRLRSLLTRLSCLPLNGLLPWLLSRGLRFLCFLLCLGRRLTGPLLRLGLQLI